MICDARTTRLLRGTEVKAGAFVGKIDHHINRDGKRLYAIRIGSRLSRRYIYRQRVTKL